MAGLVSWALSALSRLFSSQLGRWFATALVWLGLSVAVDTFVVDPLFDEIASYYTGLPADLVYALRFSAIDVGMTMILSAYAARASITAGRAFLSKRGPA